MIMTREENKTIWRWGTGGRGRRNGEKRRICNNRVCRPRLLNVELELCKEFVVVVYIYIRYIRASMAAACTRRSYDPIGRLVGETMPKSVSTK